MYSLFKLARQTMALAVVLVLTTGWVEADAGSTALKKDWKNDWNWTLGFGVPSGEGVSDYYGSMWLNLGANRLLSDTATSERTLSLGISAGVSSKDFSVGGSSPDPTADYAARLFSVRYEHKVKTNTPFFWGGGIGLYFVNTEASYDAGEGYVWTATDGRTILLSNTSMTIAPSVKAGYRIRDKVNVELGFTLINSTLTGNTSQYSYLPSVPDVKLSGLYTLSANMKF